MKVAIALLFILALSLQASSAKFLDPPSPPELCAPTNGGAVVTLRPELCVRNAPSCDSFSIFPTSQATDFGGLSCTLDGLPIPVGSIVQAWDPQGVLCGRKIVTTAGIYTVMAVYGDDHFTPRDEGCVIGDTIRFTINCFPATTLGPSSPIWIGPGPIRVLNLSAVSDSTIYHFELSMDSIFSTPAEISGSIEPGQTTSVTIPFDLAENQRYWWRAKTSNVDGESGYSPVWSFYVNSQNSAPTMFSLLSPPNSLTVPLATRLPAFLWQSSFDPDPLDTIRYTLFLAVDSSAGYLGVVPGLLSTTFVWSDSLERGQRYRWSVQANDYKGGFSWSNTEYRFRIMIPGDANASGGIDITDAVFLVNFIFAAGQSPIPLESGDVNCDDKFNIVDVVYLINYIFAGGAPPCEG